MGVFLGSTQHLEAQNYRRPLWHLIHSEKNTGQEPQFVSRAASDVPLSWDGKSQGCPGTAQMQEDEIHLGQVQESH